ncbi:hypothetical protein AC249_AIPGENE9752 [Exaiptasia diaphana]|nr:hypothetical protein AC249_AIPGENE9752 [Exaiptasia diaphana]
MEVLRPSTPMPYGRVDSTCTNTFRNRKYPSSGSIPHLQPLIEERFVKRSKTTGDLVKPFQRCTIACDEGENVEFLQLSSGHANVLRIPDKKIPSKFTCRLPCIKKDSKNDFEPWEQYEAAKPKQGERSRAKYEWKASQEHENRRQPSVSSSQSTNSLPSLEKEKEPQRLHTNQCTKKSIIQKHIEQEDKNFDPTINREVLFKKYFEGQR